MCARLSYYSLDRPDLQYAREEAASTPRTSDVTRLKRIGRYLLAQPRVALLYKLQQEPSFLNGYTDADVGGCSVTRRSTSGGAITLGSHVLHTWPTTQKLVALSSGESEYYAMLRCATECIGLNTLIMDVSRLVPKVLIWTDASAARGLALRAGHSRMKHMESRLLWPQERVSARHLQVLKLRREVNCADLFTKALDAQSIQKHLRIIGAVRLEGRRQLAALACV